MRMGGVSLLTCAVAPATPLTLSSAVKASIFGIMSWRCLAQSEHGIARPRTWHALGGLRQCGTEIPIERCPGRVGACYPLDRRPELSGNIGHFVKGSDDGPCDSAGRHRGRRPKASREGTRGELRCGM